MALLEPYVTVVEADAYLSSSVIWQAATTEEKDVALFWGRVWIDSNYTCPDLILDPSNPSDTIKYSNALLGEDYLDETLILTSPGTTPTDVKKEKKKAGSVEKEIEYFEGGGLVEIDHQDNVKMLLGLECDSLSSAGMIKLKRD